MHLRRARPHDRSAPNADGSPITDYVITFANDSGFTSPTVYNDGVSTATSATLTLPVGQDYYFKVNAVNAEGSSADSNVVSLLNFHCDTDLGGANFNPADGTNLAGIYCNIDTFTISLGTTVNTTAEQKVEIYANNADIQGTFNAQGRGFAGGPANGCTASPGFGPGGATGPTSNARDGAGGAYGGEGGNGQTGAFGGAGYGSYRQPDDLGSGGSAATGNCSSNTSGSSGGGAIKIISTGTVTIDGTIDADGNDASNSSYSGGSGSGGSIWIDANTLAGSGTITSNGGIAWDNAGSGSGGRIALHYTTKTFSGTTTAFSGYNLSATGVNEGGAGTIYEKPSSHGNLFITGDQTSGFDDTVLDTTDEGVVTEDNLTIENADVYHSNSAITVNQDTILNNAATFRLGTLNTHSFDDLTINSGANLTHIANSTTQDNVLDFTATNLTINSGGQINVNSLGFDGGLANTSCGTTTENGNGPGAGTAATGNALDGAGGAYGGEGGNGQSNAVGGSGYGSFSQPDDLGSGGAAATGSCGSASDGGDGGGAIKVIASGNIINNGTITANGQNSNDTTYTGGGGAGGSIWLDANIIAGTGSITANGGSADDLAGTGAGGRIALYYTTKSFSGTTTALHLMETYS